MIYEMDKRQLLRLWSVLSSFGEIRGTKDPIIQSEILRRAQIVLTDFVFGLKRVPEDQTSTAALEDGPSDSETDEPDDGALVAHSGSQFPAAIGIKLQPAKPTTPQGTSTLVSRERTMMNWPQFLVRADDWATGFLTGAAAASVIVFAGAAVLLLVHGV
jgi:hypothetical protein